MAYKYGRNTCFTEDGMILAFNTCKGGQFGRKYYSIHGLHGQCDIDAIIKARRELFGSIVRTAAAGTKKIAAKRHQESLGLYAAGGRCGIVEEPEIIDIGHGQRVPQCSKDAPMDDTLLPEQSACGRADDELKKFDHMSNDQQIKWMQEKSCAEMDIAAKKAAHERKLKDDDTEADNIRKRKMMEDNPLVQADYELQLFNKRQALEMAKDCAAIAKSKAAAEKSKADAEKMKADRIAAEEKIKLDRVLRIVEEEKKQQQQEA
jgi:hypothetical protein